MRILRNQFSWNESQSSANLIDHLFVKFSTTKKNYPIEHFIEIQKKIVRLGEESKLQIIYVKENGEQIQVYSGSISGKSDSSKASEEKWSSIQYQQELKFDFPQILHSEELYKNFMESITIDREKVPYENFVLLGDQIIGSCKYLQQLVLNTQFKAIEKEIYIITELPSFISIGETKQLISAGKVAKIFNSSYPYLMPHNIIIDMSDLILKLDEGQLNQKVLWENNYTKIFNEYGISIILTSYEEEPNELGTTIIV